MSKLDQFNEAWAKANFKKHPELRPLYEATAKLLLEEEPAPKVEPSIEIRIEHATPLDAARLLARELKNHLIRMEWWDEAGEARQIEKKIQVAQEGK